MSHSPVMARRRRKNRKAKEQPGVAAFVDQIDVQIGSSGDERDLTSSAAAEWRRERARELNQAVCEAQNEAAASKSRRMMSRYLPGGRQ